MRGHDITEQPSRIRRAGLGGRRLPSGPRPVRPGVVPVGVRPVQPARPATPGLARRSAALTLLSASLGSSMGAIGSTLLGSGLLGPARRSEQRVLARRAAAAPVIRTPRRRHGALVVAALMAVTATAVVLLGMLGDEVAAARLGAPTATSAAPASMAASMQASVVVAPVAVVAGRADTVTVGSEVTVWEVAERVAPAASGAQVAALAQRLVAENDLSSVRVHPGQVLRVTAG
jgi:hypothetical protein